MGRPRKVAAELVTLHPVSDQGNEPISYSEPYRVSVTISGSAPLLFHAWSNEAVAEKGNAAKGSKGKKTDNVASYVLRDDHGFLCLPGDYLKGAIVNAAKFRQDPRSPRKSAMDLYKAAVVPLTLLASLGSKDWDYLDRRRVVVQRNAITRTRPAFREGWRATIELLVTLPEYVDANSLREVIEQAGRIVGVGDFRPTFGRFGVVNYKVL